MQLKNFNFIKVFINNLIYYPTPTNLNYLRSFGFLIGIFVVIQILTGLLLVCHYTPTEFAFNSIDNIIRNVQYGWLIRYIHTVGASFIFLLLFIHIGRSLYYLNYLYPRLNVRLSGIALFFLIIAIAFFGYVLPWGQISFRAATVITNFVTVIPKFGSAVLTWVWGNFIVSPALLSRFFMLHFFLPFILLVGIIIHIFFLHENGSTNPLGPGVQSVDVIPFFPYFFLKDFFLFLVFFLLFITAVCFFPNMFTHPDNYIMANPFVTPTHIVPERYFLSYYAILRAVPNKIGGIILLVFFFLLFIVFPVILNTVLVTFLYKNTFIIFYRIFFWNFVYCFFILTRLGSQELSYPYIQVSQFFIGYLFLSIIFIFSSILVNKNQFCKK